MESPPLPPLPNQQIESTDELEGWETKFHKDYVDPQIRDVTEIGIGIDYKFENRFRIDLIAINRFSRFDSEIRLSDSINRF